MGAIAELFTGPPKMGAPSAPPIPPAAQPVTMGDPKISMAGAKKDGAAATNPDITNSGGAGGLEAPATGQKSLLGS